MLFVQDRRSARRVGAVATSAALVATLLAGLPAEASPLGADALGVHPVAGALVAPSSDVRVTGGVGLTDTAVYAETADGIVTIPRDGSATDWTPVTVGGAPLTGHLLQAEADVLLVADADGTTDTLAWRTTASDTTASNTTGTGWTTRTVPSGTRLGAGGLYVVLPAVPAPPGDPLGPSVVQVAAARSGDVVQTVHAGTAGRVAVDGRTLWRVPSSSALSATDLVTGSTTRHEMQVLLPTSPVTVVGRWASFVDDTTRVVDLDGVLANVQTPTSALEQVALGAEFVVGLTPRADGSAVVTAEQLSTARSQATFGPARATAPDVDDAGATFVYVDTDGRARLVTPTTNPPETTRVDPYAPPTPVVGIADRSITSARMTAQIAQQDPDVGSPGFLPSGLADPDFRYRQRALGAAAFGAWSSARRGSTLTLTVPHDTQTCFEARARDNAGHLSAWSGELCGTMAVSAPTLVYWRPLPQGIKVVHGKATATLGFTSSGSDQPAAYDVRYKVARKGTTTYGAWVYPKAFQDTNAVSESVTITTGQRVCFSIRVRYGSGLGTEATPWTSSHCTFADATAPKLTKVTPPARWRGVPASGKVTSTIRFSGKDDHDVHYEVRVATAGISTGAGFAWTTVRTSKTSYSRTVKAGQEACFRVRAVDTAGHASPWSATHCTNVPAPATSTYLKGVRHATVAGVRVAVLRSYPGSSRHDDTEATIFQQSSHGIRLRVRTCPTCGNLRVQTEKTLVTIPTRSNKAGWKDVDVTWKKPYGGYIFLWAGVPDRQHGAVAYIRSWSLIH